MFFEYEYMIMKIGTTKHHNSIYYTTKHMIISCFLKSLSVQMSSPIYVYLENTR